MEFKEFIFVHVSSNISHMRHSVSPDETPRREYDAQRSIFDELRGVSSGDETLCGMHAKMRHGMRRGMQK